MIDTLHDQIRYLEKTNLEKDKIILDLKKQVETKIKIINFYENPKYRKLIKLSTLLSNS
tara:strand:- start:99 stop:275 length:177 start_codon:yes stop_codon:yes gene_type:complete